MTPAQIVHYLTYEYDVSGGRDGRRGDCPLCQPARKCNLHAWFDGEAKRLSEIAMLEVKRTDAAVAERDAARAHAEALERMLADLADELPDLEHREWHYAQIKAYARADDASKAEIRAYHLSAGPARTRDAIRRVESGESGGAM